MLRMSRENRFGQILSRELQRVRRLSREHDWPFVVNEDWERILTLAGSVPKLGVVADNPGKDELSASVYLSPGGRAGKVGRRLFDLAFGGKAVEDGRVIVFNRSSLHTPRTADLNQLMFRGQPNPELVNIIRNDQRANGRLVASVAMTLGIPVLAIGGDEDGKTFESFREGFSAEVANFGEPSEPAVLFERALSCRFHRAPHFSFSSAFKKGKAIEWGARVEAFLRRYPWAATNKGNVSWKAIRRGSDEHDTTAADAARTYLLEVMLGGTCDAA